MAKRGVRPLTASGGDQTDSDDQVAGAFAEYEKGRLVAKAAVSRTVTAAVLQGLLPRRYTAMVIAAATAMSARNASEMKTRWPMSGM